jgi:branched-chain amino acid transport system substrate-binding protein
MRARIVTAGLATGLLFGVVACGGSTSGGSTGSSSTSGGTIEIGVIMSLSGPLAPYGIPSADSIEYGVAQQNRLGGIHIDGKQYRLSVKVLDDRSDQTTAIADANQLINTDGVKIIFGPLGTLAQSVAQLTQASKVINFSASGSAGSGPYVFNTQPNVQARGTAIADAVKHYLPTVKSVAIVGTNDNSGVVAAPALESAFAAAGMKANAFLFPPAQPNISPVLTKVASSSPDLVLVGFEQQAIATVFQQLPASGLKASTPVLLYGTPAGCTQYAPHRVCIAYPEISVDLTASQLSPTESSFVSGYESFTHSRSLPQQTQAPLYFYPALAPLWKALEAAGTATDTAKIVSALLSASAQNVAGTVHFASDKSLAENQVAYLVRPGQPVQAITIPAQ